MVTTTRSATSSPVKKQSSNTSINDSKKQIEPLTHFIIPRDTSGRARFVLLKHPRDSSIRRFLFSPEKGLYEFTKLSTTSTDPRSLFFDGSEQEKDITGSAVATEQPNETFGPGYISRSAEIFVATAFDVAFLLIPLVLPVKAQSGRMLFQPLDDIFEQHVENDKHLRYILENGRDVVETAMSRFCDTMEAGDEQMYRPNEDQTLRMLLQKVDSAIEKGLPPSMEEKFVARALEAPVLSVKREDTIISTTRSESLAQEENDAASDSFDSQSTSASSAPSAVFSEVSVASSVSTVVSISETVSKELIDLRKQSMILDFILASYLPTSIADRLKARLSAKDSPINLAPLEEHMKSLAALRAEAMASRSIGDFSRKRGLDDEETADFRAEKKRKQEEEDRKKKLSESRGVRDLKKVNVSGMKKMSDFFGKKPVAKAKG
ncbi:ribonuclease H2, subunit B [Exophiala viscosa]|uniref:ribonuclease H2, subunit B n=1 Tax=Exophiala viscosa TaxID=2486360 RepID=UPI002198ACF6|nr:ribonuclease H2, subunit B [Exophiala viscosa]